MTTTEYRESLKAEVEAALPSIWAVALITAVVSAVPVALTRHSEPYVIMYPILIGAGFCVAVELYRKLKTQRDAAASLMPAIPVERFGSGFSNFADLREIAVVELAVPEPTTKRQSGAQLELVGAGFHFEQRAPSKEKFRIFRTPEGKELIALDCDRFSAMLTTEALGAFDASFEKSLEITLMRFSGSSMKEDQLFALTDDTAKDILKTDIRGNLATFLARTNDHLVKMVLGELRRALVAKGTARPKVVNPSMPPG
jgi:hypothetical protein